MKRSLVAFLFLCTVPSATAMAKDTIGWIEKARLIKGHGMIMHAKIDTGADFTSVNARDITIYQKQGEDWVKFRLDNNDGDAVELDRPIIRYAEIKRRSGEPQRRPVILMGLCLGNQFSMTEINLVDRSHFSYQLLVGRSFLEGRFLVDSENTYMKQPECVMSDP